MNDFKQSLLALFEAAKKAWQEIKELFRSAQDTREEIKKEQKFRATWVAAWDTRKASQVVSRKPLFAFQKII